MVLEGEPSVRGPLFVVTMTCAAVSVALLLAAVRACARRRWLGGLSSVALGLVLLVLAALAAALSLGTQGYRAMTRGPGRTTACSRLPPASAPASLPLPAAADTWR